MVSNTGIVIVRAVAIAAMLVGCGSGLSATDATDTQLTDAAVEQLPEGGRNADAAVEVRDVGSDENESSAEVSDAAPDMVMECPFMKVGCFTGQICASSQVPAICRDGRWTCPPGSQASDFCPVDGALDGSADQGGGGSRDDGPEGMPMGCRAWEWPACASTGGIRPLVLCARVSPN
jgi:hypothetical protein